MNVKDQLIKVQLSVEVSSDPGISSSSYSCNKFYKVSVPAGTLKKVGFYQLNVYAAGYNLENPVLA